MGAGTGAADSLPGASARPTSSGRWRLSGLEVDDSQCCFVCGSEVARGPRFVVTRSGDLVHVLEVVTCAHCESET